MNLLDACKNEKYTAVNKIKELEEILVNSTNNLVILKEIEEQRKIVSSVDSLLSNHFNTSI